MSNDAVTGTPASTTTAAADEVVTLVILYDKPGISFAAVRIPVTRAQAMEIVSSRDEAPCAVAMIRGFDANGNPYSLDVGTVAVAVYVES